MIKVSEKKWATSTINLDNGLEIKKNILISVPYVHGLSEEVKRIFGHTTVQVILKGTNILKSILMHPKDRIPSQLKQNIVYIWPCQDENCNLPYLGESGRCLENRVKEHNSHVTSAVYDRNMVFLKTTPGPTSPTSR